MPDGSGNDSSLSVQTDSGVPSEVFSASRITLKKQAVEKWMKRSLMVVTILIILPLLAILTTLFVNALPALSFDFLWENPRDAMTAGGIYRNSGSRFQSLYFRVSHKIWNSNLQ